MKKIITSIIVITFLTITLDIKAQVWFPEGGYNFVQPSVFSIDKNQIYTIGKASEDLTKSYWLVAKYDGKSWIKLPILTLNKTAEVLQIQAFGGSLYVSGNFSFDNGLYAALVRFKDLSWQAVAKIERINQIAPVISALDIFDNKLIIGGNFNTIGTDTFQYIAAYNGVTFSNILARLPNCKNCFPNYFVTDLSANDTLLAISGYFNAIGNKSSKSLFLLNINGKSDTFLATPNNTLFDKVTITNGKTIYASGFNSIDKKINIYKADKGYTNLKNNFDSIIKINSLETYENNLWMNGIAKITNKNIKTITNQLLNDTLWVDFTSNYANAKSLAVGRGAIWAIGNSEKPISIWNPNKHVVRLYQNSALVKVNVFLDSNNNCIQEKNESGVAKQLVKLSTSQINKFSVTNELGLAEFLFNIPNGAAQVKFNVILPKNMLSSKCSFDSIKKTFVNHVKYMDSIAFPVTRKFNINDIRVFISAPKGTQVMKDKRMEYLISIENVGSNIVSGKMTLKKDKWLSSEKTDGKLDTSTVEWIYANLNPGEKRLYNYSGVASDSRYVDNTILQAQAFASISSVKNDYSGDDSDSIQQIIDNGSSPFRKDIYPIPNNGDSISYLSNNDREIRYNISFNNFATDTVYNAVIVDTLDLNLDMSYIQETGSNKTYYTEIQTDPNNSNRGIIIWHFPNINLIPNPSKNFETPNSGSYIGFKVVLKPINNGYIVKNTAAAFYDNSYIGKTNVTYCTIANTSVKESILSNKHFLLYPNPASNNIQLELSLDLNDKFRIINQQGLQVKSGTIENKSESLSIDIEALSNGIYILQVIKGNQIYYSKFVKM